MADLREVHEWLSLAQRALAVFERSRDLAAKATNPDAGRLLDTVGNYALCHALAAAPGLPEPPTASTPTSGEDGSLDVAASYGRGYRAGHKQGADDGYEEGYTDGYVDGRRGVPPAYPAEEPEEDPKPAPKGKGKGGQNHHGWN